MMRVLLAVLVLVLFSGCASVQKYVDQGLDAGMKAAEKEAAKFVDKEGGTGTYEDTKMMKGDQDKLDNLLPYYIAVNKMCDEKKIDETKRDELKVQFDNYYADWKEGKITKENYDKKCTECIENAKSVESQP